MDTDGADQRHRALAANPPAGAKPSAPVVDADFKVIHPWRPWRRLRRGWWAIGPYLAYCTALWGLAALVAWLIDHSRAG
jgi:hypothetical protein